MNLLNLKELAEQIAIPLRHLRYLLEQIEWYIPKTTVWAFGSRVKWSHRTESDLDLAVHCDKETAQKALPKLNYALDESNLPFKVQILDYDRLPENMQANIKKNYLVLYQPSEKPIPSDWKETTLGEVGKVVTGKTPSRDNPEHWGDLLGFITPSDIKNDSKYIYKTGRYISPEGLEAFERMVIPRNSVIVTCIGSDMGKVVMNTGDCITNQQINSLTVNDAEYDRDFVYYRLKNSYSLLRMHADGGSTMPILNKSTFEGLIFSIPPLPEQKAIAAILSSFDDKIELLRRQNKTLEKIAQTIFKEWFVNFNVNGKKQKVNSSTGLPDGWRIGKYGQLVDVTTGKGLKKQFIKEKGKYSILGANGELGKTDNYLFDEDLILTGRVGTLGTVYICKGKVWISDNVLISKPLCAENFYFIYFNLKRLNFESLNRGSTQPLITQTDLKNVEAIIPKQEVLGAWHNAVSSLFAKIYNNNSQIQTLSKLRDTLLPKLMKGEIRIGVTNG